MKPRLLGFFALFLVALAILFVATKTAPTTIKKLQKSSVLPTKQPVLQNARESIFVPYWGIDTGLSKTLYQQYIYFSVTPTTTGLITLDDGYRNIQKFSVAIPPSSHTLLALSMLDPTVNEAVISNPSLQKKLIDQTLSVAKSDGFSGVVLDVEYKALAFDSVVRRVTAFSKMFASSAHAQHLLFYQALSGDTWYRAKPYDLKALGQIADGIFVMAYDLHKAGGNPGPNFPLVDEQHDYDLHAMTRDFLKAIPVQKLTVVFGLFGYDWPVDASGNATDMGKSMSYKDIHDTFLDSCALLDCQIKRDTHAQETKITYTDTSGEKHVVWFEDMQSVAAKKAYLRSMGISSFAYWAYSYF